MQNQNINFFKGIACLLIILIHCRFPGKFGELIVVLSRVAVFYFFIVSGYYSFYSDEKKFRARMPVKIRRLSKMMIVTFGLYFIWECVLRQFGSSGNLKYYLFHELFTLQSLFKVIIFQVDVLVGPFWFLLALLLCYIVVFFGGKERIRYCYILIPVTLILNVILSEILPLFDVEVSLYYYRNFWLTGFPFYFFGYILHDKQKYIEQYFTQKEIFFLIVIGNVISLIEFYFVGNSLIYVGNVISVCGVFLLAIKTPNGGNKQIAKLGSYYSMYVYCLHWFVIDVLAIIAKHAHVIECTVYRYAAPVIVEICSIIGAIVINFLNCHMIRVRHK